MTTHFSEVLQELPDESAPFYMDDDDDDQARPTGSEQIECSVGQPMETVINQCSELCLHVGTPKVPNRPSFKDALARRLLMNDRTSRSTRTFPTTRPTECRGKATESSGAATF